MDLRSDSTPPLYHQLSTGLCALVKGLWRRSAREARLMMNADTGAADDLSGWRALVSECGRALCATELVVSIFACM